MAPQERSTFRPSKNFRSHCTKNPGFVKVAIALAIKELAPEYLPSLIWEVIEGSVPEDFDYPMPKEKPRSKFLRLLILYHEKLDCKGLDFIARGPSSEREKHKSLISSLFEEFSEWEEENLRTS